MWVENILRNEDILFVLYSRVLRDHFDASTTCLVGWFHDPKLVLIGSLTSHLKSIIICGEDVCIGDKIVCLWETSSLFVEIFPHIVFSSKVPTAWKMVDFLKFIHILKSPQVCPTDIEINIPFSVFLVLDKAIVFKCIDDAFVL
jgi:hypothetical protein